MGCLLLILGLICLGIPGAWWIGVILIVVGFFE